MPRLTLLSYDWTLILLVLAINTFSVFVIRSVRPDLFPYQPWPSNWFLAAN